LLKVIKSHQKRGKHFQKIDLSEMLQKVKATVQDLSVEALRAAIDQAGDLSAVVEIGKDDEDDDDLKKDLRV
jgi:cell fate (sporulation/competence/biofilm development) regulator YmcA (YheA/YmcA/DUF963 family)